MASLIRPPSPAIVLPVTGPFTAASITIAFAANAYKRIDITVDWNAGTLSNVALTGMAAASYNQEQVFGSNAAPGSSGITGANNWAIAASSGPGTALMFLAIPPAPSRKGMTLDVVQTGGTMVGLSAYCMNTDAANDPTAVVLTFDASRTGYIYAVGYQ